MLNRLLVIILFCSSCQLYSQQYNYTVTTDSITYSSLEDDSVLTAGAKWSDTYSINPGFTIPFGGSSFNSFVIERNNYFSFDAERKYSLLTFPGFSNKNCPALVSSLSYKVEGVSPSRICKVQVKNVGQGNQATEFLNYQVWLYENGKIDFITGSHTYPTADSTTVSDTLNTIQLGLINTKLDGSVNGLFLSGGASSPSPVPFTAGSEMSFILSMPVSGTRYSFMPSN